MQAVDTNVLVYAHRRDSPFHSEASARLTALVESPVSWAIPWPCIHEFFAIVTHPRIYRPPSSIDQAINQIEAWMESPSLVLLAENSAHWTELASLVRGGEVVGPVVHDARIAALCLSHQVSELLTLDRDFSRFPRLATKSIAS